MAWRGFGSTVGGINRNMVGKAASVGAILVLFSPSKSAHRVALAMSGALIVIVTSRGTLVAACVFFSVYYVLQFGSAKAVGYAILAAFLCSAILLTSQKAQTAVFERVMRLHDENRGLGSGFTGRVGSWESGLDAFHKHPIFGYGFRASEVGGVLEAHSGYIRLLVETGIIGTMFAVSAPLIESLRRAKLAIQFRKMLPSGLCGVDLQDSVRLNAIVAGIMCTMLTLWVYEPVYLNLGTVMSVLFFMGFGAPNFVPGQATLVPAASVRGT